MREQLGARPGHQRVIDGDGELLLVVHEVPQAGIPERQARFFWKTRQGTWLSDVEGREAGELHALLDRYARAIDQNEEKLEEAKVALEIFQILRHAAPLLRSLRNLVAALEDVLRIDADDREVLAARDRGKELERAAELLFTDARSTMEFYRAEKAEEHAESAEALSKIAFRLNLLAGFFLPLVAMGGLFGMNVDLPEFTKGLFWVIVVGGLGTGAVLLWIVGRRTKP